MLTGAQVRQALAALRWSEDDLAAATSLHRNTINDLTRLDGELISAKMGTVITVKRTLEAAGCDFVAAGESGTANGAGVVLRPDAKIKERIPRGRAKRQTADRIATENGAI
ncbi:hypothetical protein [Azospirillum canadense]|uniref:hypothetical protein n=1 Tax=Azospirillum canadense TaxID=403962 RepID=UPI00222739E5|nr:hypothetical protein [Azospirillum canadense]MCW2242235.1 hypothetical protein [Azospirillum canadense]